MAVTITVSTSSATSRGVLFNEIDVEGSIAFDDSYPTNGESVTAAAMTTALDTAGYPNVTVSAINSVICDPQIISSALYVGQWVPSTSKLKVLKLTNSTASTTATMTDSTPTLLTLVAAETVSVAADVGTLAKAPVAITSVRSSAEGGGGVKAVCIMTDTTPQTKESQVSLTNKTVTFAAADKVTEAKVTYVYQTAGVATTNSAGSNGTDSSFAEVTNATDLAALTFKFRAVCAL